MVRELAHATAIQHRRQAAQRRGVARAVVRYLRRGHAHDYEAIKATDYEAIKATQHRRVIVDGIKSRSTRLELLIHLARRLRRLEALTELALLRPAGLCAERYMAA